MSSSIKGMAEFIWEVAKIVILALAIVIPIRYFLFQPFVISGSSMEPNFHDADYLIINEISYRFRPPIRGEVIVFKYPSDPSKRFIKRLIGLPGETVEIKDGRVIVAATDGRTIALDETYLPAGLKTPDMPATKLNEDQYFVLGDNRLYSSDSRVWGDVSQGDIIGKAELRLWPLNDISRIATPQY